MLPRPRFFYFLLLALPLASQTASFDATCGRVRCEAAAIAEFHKRYEYAIESGTLDLAALAGSDETEAIDRMLQAFLNHGLLVRRRDVRDLDGNFLRTRTSSATAPPTTLAPLYLYTELDCHGLMAQVMQSGPLPAPPKGKQWTSAQSSTGSYWVLDDGRRPAPPSACCAPRFSTNCGMSFSTVNG